MRTTIRKHVVNLCRHYGFAEVINALGQAVSDEQASLAHDGFPIAAQEAKTCWGHLAQAHDAIAKATA